MIVPIFQLKNKNLYFFILFRSNVLHILYYHYFVSAFVVVPVHLLFELLQDFMGFPVVLEDLLRLGVEGCVDFADVD